MTLIFHFFCQKHYLIKIIFIFQEIITDLEPQGSESETSLDLQSSEILTDLELADLQSSETSAPLDLQSSEEDFTPVLVFNKQFTKV